MFSATTMKTCWTAELDTGSGTDTVADDARPPLLALISAAPGPVAVTTPWLLTEATASSELVQMTVRSVRAFPAESRSVAVSCTVAPEPSERYPGATLTEATRAGGLGVVSVGGGSV